MNFVLFFLIVIWVCFKILEGVVDIILMCVMNFFNALVLGMDRYLLEEGVSGSSDCFFFCFLGYCVPVSIKLHSNGSSRGCLTTEGRSGRQIFRNLNFAHL